MHAVGTDDEIEAPPRSACETHLDILLVLVELGDFISEDALDATLDAAIELCSQVAPKEAYVAVPQYAPDGFSADARAGAALGVHGKELAHLVTHIP